MTKTNNEGFFKTHKKQLIFAFFAAFFTAAGGFLFIVTKNTIVSSAMKIDNRYNNIIVEQKLEQKINEKDSKLRDDVSFAYEQMTEQSVKMLQRFQRQLDFQALYDLKLQRALIEKELERHPNDTFLIDRLEFINKKIKSLEDYLLFN